MRRDIQFLRTMYSPGFRKPAFPKIAKASRLIASSMLMIYLTGSALGQGPDSPGKSRSGDQTTPQICDGEQAREQSNLSLQRRVSPASDAAQMSTLAGDRIRMHSEAVGDQQESSAASATEQHPLQCLHPRKESLMESPVSDPVVPVTRPPVSVTLNEGMLTVDPHGAPLGEVLGAIRAVVGFELDISGSQMDKRVFGQIGPLPVQELLLQLLYGSEFNYIIQTASGNQQVVTRVFVSPRMGSPTDTGTPQPAELLADDAGLDRGLDPSQEQIPQPVAQQIPTRNPGNIPGVPAGFDIKKAAEEAHKSPAEILDEMQKRQLELLDAQAPQQQ